jgi:hypothetical protein
MLMSFLKPYLKAIMPAVLGALVSVINTVIAGGFNNLSVGALALGFVSALATYLVPNKPAPAVPPPIK